MGFSLLAPLFMAGAGLLIAPYLIHQIRRPEREPIRFSSVMFIPNVQKDVIERRRIQHLLLMMLRMLLLLLLAAAFSRPYWKALAAEDSELGPTRHAVLLDTSYSMGAQGVFERARRAASKVIADIAPGDAISVMTFAETLHVAAPFESQTDPKAGSKEAARRAVDAARVGNAGTSYVNALELAHRHAASSSQAQSGASERLILHVISDFQKSGMPKQYTGWKLPPTVELDLIPVRSDFARNHAVTDTHIRKSADGTLRVLAKVRNWSDRDIEDLVVSLVLNDKEVDRNTLSIRARSAMQTSFQLEASLGKTLEGHIKLEDDDLQIDNLRYFTWNPPRKTRVLIVAEERPDDPWPTAWFFQQALPTNPDLPWTTELVRPARLAEYLDTAGQRPKVIIACDMEGTEVAETLPLLEFAEKGGQVLYLLNASMDPESLNTTLFKGLGVSASKMRFSTMRPTQFELMSWVDLDHPLFVPFQGSRFNDFSTLRFFNYMMLETDDDTRVLARFDDDSPAMVELAVGAGRMIVWPFPVHLDWTNLPKNPRFVPLLYETLAYLADLQEGAIAWRVGQRIPADVLVLDDSGAGIVQLPGNSAEIEVALEDEGLSDRLLLRGPGFFRTKSSRDSEWRQVDATNVEPTEGDLTPIATAEFLTKVAAAPPLDTARTNAGIVGANVDAEGYLISKEYGRALLFALLALVLVESWYMSFLKG
ncbi:MAG: BatA and WFA domain-containing protein [Candidatus Hydrogenedentes bacterium]|nr:BatA and WFA domain-containing protein [Candidatus Hydrogenedentota bacterium]